MGDDVKSKDAVSVSVERKKKRRKRKTKQEQRAEQQRALYVRFPFNDELSMFETQEFDCVMMAKTFIEESEAELAAIVNEAGSRISTYALGVWYSYV